MTEFHAGDQIGDYRLEARLGHGGFGTVWRARHVASGRLVALKVLPENDSIQDSASLRADVELLAASAASNSPHIVRVFGGGIDPVPHVIMEFVNGSSLAEELKNRGKLSQQEVLEIGLGIAEALEALQAVGIVHRDVKPSNVLIDRNGTVKLTDFGIAKIAGYDAVTATGQLPLSIAYAAPEVWEGKAEHRSDLYALGVLLYQCLTGSLPFRGAYAELFYQHRSQAPDLGTLPAGTPRSLIDLINITLRKNPGERPEGAATCKAMLLQAREELLTEAIEEEVLVEPVRFGPWIKGDPHATLPWAWHCHNLDTGDEAVVELHFATDAEYGEALRRAVAANDRLTPLGAEHLLQTNRLILRPGEAWTQPPAGQFQFWIARDEIPLPEPPSSISAGSLLGYTESVQALFDAAEDAGVPLEVSKDTLKLLPDGSVHLRRPGLAIGREPAGDREVLEYFRSLPLSREVRPLVSRARTLTDLRSSLERLQTMAASSSGAQQPPSGRRPGRRLLAAGFAALGLIFVAAIAAWQLGGPEPDGEDTPVVVAPSPTAAIPTATPTACERLVFPASLAEALASCTGSAVTVETDLSCPTGTACRRETQSDKTVMYVNDYAVAYIDEEGILKSRESNLDTLRLQSVSSAVEAIDWSPDGRYLVYLTRTETGGQTADNNPAVSTQLWLADTTRPSTFAVLMASHNERGSSGRLISSPHWSADGSMILFLWSSPDQPGGELHGVDVPYTSAGEVDYTKIRSGVPANEYYVSTTNNVLELEASDFGLAINYFGGFVVADDGTLYLQVCQGSGSNRSCGIGRWDGASATMLVGLQPGVVYGLPVSSPFDGTLHVAKFQEGSWSLARLEGDAVVPVPGIQFIGSSSASPPVFTFNRLGDALIYETAPNLLSLVGYNGVVQQTWGEGFSPAWYVAGKQTDAPVDLPDLSPYLPPAPTPTPAASPTPPAPSLQQMTILITVRNSQGADVSGATVQAKVGDTVCASVVTGPGASSMPFPGANSPTVCRQGGAQIRFVVGDVMVSDTLNYLPGANLPVDLRLP